MITILVSRSPDYGDEVQVWRGDVEITMNRDVHVVVVDAGAGYEYKDWVDNAAAEIASIKHAVPRATIAAVYADPPGKEYIDGWPDDDD